MAQGTDACRALGSIPLFSGTYCEVLRMQGFIAPWRQDQWVMVEGPGWDTSP